ncbi:MAG: phosphate acyltransferase PlsX [Bacteroidales bacterium]|nr:phosphate acyltransferase PlsX [Bacteroidales bacterium]MBS3774728.1 phosphate acyltransferase PlsX [Bacteroidales bacterium]
MRIGVDIMGGDFAPEATVSGAILAKEVLNSNVELILIGDENKINNILKEKGFVPNHFEIIHADQTIQNGENPAKAFTQKPWSSIKQGFALLEEGRINGFASAGNTGAMMVGAMYTIKPVAGILRPAITASVPQFDGDFATLLDVGINPDCKPDVLYQYGLVGSIYAKHVYHKENPRVGLINIGAEEEKGNLVVRSAYEMMKGTKSFNFIGNVEGNEIFDSKADVLVCDGFVGNIILKEAEALYKLLRKKGIKDEYFERFNFENIGGTPLLGVNGNIIIGHGISNHVAIKNMIIHTQYVIQANLSEKIKEAFQ